MAFASLHLGNGVGMWGVGVKTENCGMAGSLGIFSDSIITSSSSSHPSPLNLLYLLFSPQAPMMLVSMAKPSSWAGGKQWHENHVQGLPLPGSKLGRSGGGRMSQEQWPGSWKIEESRINHVMPCHMRHEHQKSQLCPLM